MILATRRGLRLLGVLCLVAALPSTLRAQAARRPVTVGLLAGGTVPLGSFADDVKTGWHAGGYLQYEPDANVWGVRGEVIYFRSDFTDAFLSDNQLGQDDKAYNGTVYAGATALLMGTRRNRGVTPYLMFGLGFYRLSASLETSGVTQSTSEDGFGFNGGLGMRFGRTSGVVIEARFHQFKIDPSNYQMIPVSVGIAF
jgi:opacity protein-like surface antigen